LTPCTLLKQIVLYMEVKAVGGVRLKEKCQPYQRGGQGILGTYVVISGWSAFIKNISSENSPQKKQTDSWILLFFYVQIT
jgi:hypothetical protein